MPLLGVLPAATHVLGGEFAAAFTCLVVGVEAALVLLGWLVVLGLKFRVTGTSHLATFLWVHVSAPRQFPRAGGQRAYT